MAMGWEPMMNFHSGIWKYAQQQTMQNFEWHSRFLNSENLFVQAAEYPRSCRLVLQLQVCNGIPPLLYYTEHQVLPSLRATDQSNNYFSPGHRRTLITAINPLSPSWSPN
jgi:hypothetical protein